MRTWLKEMRVQHKLTMKELGEKLGISESYYCAIEKGERQKKMDITLISSLATIFGCPLSNVVEAEQKWAAEH